jgi:glutaminyl-tRNA synthetase
VITNYPEDRSEEIEAVNNPEAPEEGTRAVPFCRELWIERDDFREEAPRKFYRLKPGQEVRLRYAYLVTCTGFVKDEASGEIKEIHCTYDPETRGGDAPGGRKVRGTIHWASARHAVPSEVRMYDRLFRTERPDEVDEGEDFKSNLNPDSLVAVTAMVEPAAATVPPGTRLQFERKGYFFSDPTDHGASKPVFNRIATLRDSWAKVAGKG